MSVLDLFGAGEGGEDVLEVSRDEKEPERSVEVGLSLPLAWGLQEVPPWWGPANLPAYRPTRPWHDLPATEKQIWTLEGFRLSPRSTLTRGEASHLIKQCMLRQEQFLAKHSTRVMRSPLG